MAVIQSYTLQKSHLDFFVKTRMLRDLILSIDSDKKRKREDIEDLSLATKKRQHDLLLSDRKDKMQHDGTNQTRNCVKVPASRISTISHSDLEVEETVADPEDIVIIETESSDGLQSPFNRLI